MSQLETELGRGGKTGWVRSGERKDGQREITRAGWRWAGVGLARDVVCPGEGHPGLVVEGWPVESGVVGQVTQRIRIVPRGGSRTKRGRVQQKHASGLVEEGGQTRSTGPGDGGGGQ